MQELIKYRHETVYRMALILPNDSKDLKLKKLLFVGSVLFLETPPSTLIGIIIWVFGSNLIGGLLFFFAGLGLVIVFLINLMPRYYTILMNCELLNVLLIPYLAMIFSGGILEKLKKR